MLKLLLVGSIVFFGLIFYGGICFLEYSGVEKPSIFAVFGYFFCCLVVAAGQVYSRNG